MSAIVLTAPHANTDTAAGDKGSGEMAEKLAEQLPAMVIYSDALRLPGLQDSNRYSNTIQSPELLNFQRKFQAALKSTPKLLLDIHSYGDKPHKGIQGSPMVYAMHFPNDEIQSSIANQLNIQTIFASDENYILSEARKKNIPSLLLEFNPEAHGNATFVREFVGKIQNLQLPLRV